MSAEDRERLKPLHEVETDLSRSTRIAPSMQILRFCALRRLVPPMGSAITFTTFTMFTQQFTSLIT